MKLIWRWWKKRNGSTEETEKIREQSKETLEVAKQIERRVDAVARRGEQLQRRNGFLADIERAIGGQWS